MPKAKFSPAYRHLRTLIIGARRANGLRQADVARKLRRPQSYVSKVESGERRLDVVEFIQFADAIGADPVGILRSVVGRRDR